MLALKKIFVVIKNYWYIPLVIAGAILLFLMRKKNNMFVEILQHRVEKNKQELAELDKIQEEKLEKQRQAEVQAAAELKRIQEEYDQAKEGLDDKKKKEVEKLLKKDPKKLANDLSGLMGFKVVEVPADK
jgi:aspartyl/asparaginyl-tRNA synthetase